MRTEFQNKIPCNGGSVCGESDHFGHKTPGSGLLLDCTLLTAEFLMDSFAESFPEDQIKTYWKI